jgi:single-strand DNA-binding protein
MNDTMITFHGWTGSDVRHRTAKGVNVATVRVAATPRIKKDGDWVDGETTWYSVTAWRTLADHLRDSLRKGDPVIVHGRLRTETWAPEGSPPSTTLHVDAQLVGHDLTRGITHFIKRSERVVADEEGSAELSEGTERESGEDESERDAMGGIGGSEAEEPQTGHVAA